MALFRGVFASMALAVSDWYYINYIGFHHLSLCTYFISSILLDCCHYLINPFMCSVFYYLKVRTACKTHILLYLCKPAVSLFVSLNLKGGCLLFPMDPNGIPSACSLKNIPCVLSMSLAESRVTPESCVQLLTETNATL